MQETTKGEEDREQGDSRNASQELESSSRETKRERIGTEAKNPTLRADRRGQRWRQTSPAIWGQREIGTRPNCPRWEKGGSEEEQVVGAVSITKSQ
jgi:hypothetical protein